MFGYVTNISNIFKLEPKNVIQCNVLIKRSKMLFNIMGKKTC